MERGGEDLWETWDGEGRMYDLEDCVNVVRERFVLGTSVRVGKVAMRGFTVP